MKSLKTLINRFFEKRLAIPAILFVFFGVETICMSLAFSSSLSVPALGALLLIAEIVTDMRWKDMWADCMLNTNNYRNEDWEYGFGSDNRAKDFEGNLVIWNLLDLALSEISVFVILIGYLVVLSHENETVFYLIPALMSMGTIFAHWFLMAKRSNLIEEEAHTYRKLYAENKEKAKCYLDRCEQIH